MPSMIKVMLNKRPVKLPLRNPGPGRAYIVVRNGKREINLQDFSGDGRIYIRPSEWGDKEYVARCHKDNLIHYGYGNTIEDAYRDLVLQVHKMDLWFQAVLEGGAPVVKLAGPLKGWRKVIVKLLELLPN